MPQKPVPVTDDEPTAATGRPRLVITARTPRRSADAVEETLAGPERTWTSAIEAHAAGVASMIDTLAAEAEAAAQRIRAQAQMEIAGLEAEMTGLRAAVDRLQAELLVEQDRSRSTNERLDIEAAARVRADSERDETRRMWQTAVSEAEELRAESDAQKAELSLARRQLHAARAECSKLMATFETVQRVLSLGQPGDTMLEGENTRRYLVTEAQNHPPETQAENRSDTSPALTDLASPPAANPQSALMEAHPEAAEKVRQVLEQVEAMHRNDLNSGRSPMEVVDALTGHLRQARDVIVAGSGLSESDAEALFELQISVLLDLKGGTTFGRHLSISAYARGE